MADLFSLIPSRTRVELLKIFVLEPESSFHINQLSRRTGFSPRGVEIELKNLLSGGILKREISGNLHRYQLDPLCPIIKELRAMITKTVGVVARIKNALAPLENQIEQAFVYGSFATGEYGNESDVDLFVVTDLTGLKLAELLGPVQNEIGRSINISQFTLDEYKSRLKKKDHFLQRIAKGPKIPVLGNFDEF
jgi:predicted nucleotidyltransferase